LEGNILKTMPVLGIVGCFIIAGVTASGVETELEKQKIIPFQATINPNDTSYDGEWNKTYGGVKDDFAYEVLLLQDGYMIAGVTASYGAGKSDIWIIRTDGEGNEIWNKTYGGEEAEYTFDIIPTEDGYIIAGQTFSFSRGLGDGWLIKIDENGNEIWNKTYGGKDDDDARCILKVDNGYIFAAGSRSFNRNGGVWIVKVDENGNEIWNKTYGGKEHEIGYSIIETDDGYLVGGITSSYGHGGYDIWVIKIDENGNEIWNKTYGGAGEEYGGILMKTTDGYIILGETFSYGKGGEDIWAIKVDENGNEIWNKTYGSIGDDYCGGNSGICRVGKGFIFVASLNASFPRRGTLGIVKAREDGSVEWERRIDGRSFDYGTAIKKIEDGYIIAGMTSSFGAGKTDAWLVKILPPPFNISISGGFGIKVIIENTVGYEIENLKWNIDLEGLIFFGATSSGSISKLSPDEDYAIHMLPFGIGPGSLRIEINDISKTRDFFIIGPFVSINQ